MLIVLISRSAALCIAAREIPFRRRKGVSLLHISDAVSFVCFGSRGSSVRGLWNEEKGGALSREYSEASSKQQAANSLRRWKIGRAMLCQGAPLLALVPPKSHALRIGPAYS